MAAFKIDLPLWVDGDDLRQLMRKKSMFDSGVLYRVSIEVPCLIPWSALM